MYEWANGAYPMQFIDGDIETVFGRSIAPPGNGDPHQSYVEIDLGYIYLVDKISFYSGTERIANAPPT